MRLTDELGAAVKTLCRTPGLSLATVGLFALGIGVTAAAMAVASAVLMRPLPYTDPGALVAVHVTGVEHGGAGAKVPSPLVARWQDGARSLDGLCTYAAGRTTWTMASGEPMEVATASTCTSFLAVLGGPPLARGRFFGNADTGRGAAPVAVISDAFWRNRLGGASSIVGSTIRIGGTERTILGVMSPAFRFPGLTVPDVYLPLRLPPADAVVAYTDALARLGPGTTIESAERELTAIHESARPTYPPRVRQTMGNRMQVALVPLHADVVATARPALQLALGAGFLIFLLTAVSGAGLGMAHAERRHREHAIHAALGATPGRQWRAAFMQVVILACGGGAAALLALWWTVASVRVTLARWVPRAADITIDTRTILAALIAALVAALLASAASVWARGSARPDWLPASARLLSRGRRAPLQQGLVAVQVTLAVVLLTGALMLVDTLRTVTGPLLGFRPDDVATFRMTGIEAAGVPDDGNARSRARRRDALVADILERLRALPGVIAAGAATALPLREAAFSFAVAVEGFPPPPDDDVVSVDAVSAGYAAAVGASFTRGRDFSETDGADSAPVAIVNDTFAGRYGGTDAVLGRRISLGGSPDEAAIAIVGVVQDVQNTSPGQPAMPAVWRPLAQAWPQAAWSTLGMAVRTTPGAGALVASTFRTQATAAAGTATFYDWQSMNDRLSGAVVPERQRAALASALAALALGVTALGLYVLLACTVSNRLYELGVRAALGASRAALARWVVGTALGPVVIGGAVGLALSVRIDGVLGAVLHGTAPAPAAVVPVVALVIALVSALAVWRPARRAMGVDPLAVLRAE